MSECKCYAAMSKDEPLIPFTIKRRSCSKDDVAISIKYAGICHSDIHQVRSEWGPATYPIVPGHEIGGIVTEVGSNVMNFKVGDVVGVGCMVDSCRECRQCKKGDEQYCSTGCVFTYNGSAKYPHCAEYTPEGGAPTYGGYSESVVVDKNFVLKIPTNLDLAQATPLLCAGITVYSPMLKYGLRSNHRFAVFGLGGLGHMAAKFSKAFGCNTTVISRGTAKRESALRDLKADSYIDSTDAEAMKAAAKSFDFIIDTVAAKHDINAVASLLDNDGKVVIVGVPSETMDFHAFSVVATRRSICGSLIGGIQETQEMLDFCGRNNITCDIELIKAQAVNDAYEKAIRGDVKYRFVIDIASL